MNAVQNVDAGRIHKWNQGMQSDGTDESRMQQNGHKEMRG